MLVKLGVGTMPQAGPEAHGERSPLWDRQTVGCSLGSACMAAGTASVAPGSPRPEAV